MDYGKPKFCTGGPVEWRRLTKLDGTASCGVALAVVKQMDLPIRFIGAGEEVKTSALFPAMNSSKLY